MKNLFNTLMENNISNDERQYRQFAAMLKVYGVDDPNSIEVKLTPKNNYAIYKDGKRICLFSKNIISSEVLTQNGIKFS